MASNPFLLVAVSSHFKSRTTNKIIFITASTDATDELHLTATLGAPA
jgi:hypothetical protein